MFEELKGRAEAIRLTRGLWEWTPGPCGSKQGQPPPHHGRLPERPVLPTQGTGALSCPLTSRGGGDAPPHIPFLPVAWSRMSWPRGKAGVWAAHTVLLLWDGAVWPKDGPTAQGGLQGWHPHAQDVASILRGRREARAIKGLDKGRQAICASRCELDRGRSRGLRAT